MFIQNNEINLITSLFTLPIRSGISLSYKQSTILLQTIFFLLLKMKTLQRLTFHAFR